MNATLRHLIPSTAKCLIALAAVLAAPVASLAEERVVSKVTSTAEAKSVRFERDTGMKEALSP